MMEEILRAAATKQASILQGKVTDCIRRSSVRLVECTQTIKGKCGNEKECFFNVLLCNIQYSMSMYNLVLTSTLHLIMCIWVNILKVLGFVRPPEMI